MNILLTSHTDLCVLDQSPNSDANKSAEDCNTGATELDSDGAQIFVLAVEMVLKDIPVPHVEHFNKTSLELVLVMVMNPCLPEYSANVFQFVPMALLIVYPAQNDHCLLRIMVANMRTTIDYPDDFLIVFDSMAMAVFPTKRA